MNESIARKLMRMLMSGGDYPPFGGNPKVDPETGAILNALVADPRAFSRAAKEAEMGEGPMTLPVEMRRYPNPGEAPMARDAAELRNYIALMQRQGHPRRPAESYWGNVSAPGDIEAFNAMQNLREREAEMLEALAGRGRK